VIVVLQHYETRDLVEMHPIRFIGSNLYILWIRVSRCNIHGGVSVIFARNSTGGGALDFVGLAIYTHI
jgi:hypothetical protein